MEQLNDRFWVTFVEHQQTSQFFVVSSVWYISYESFQVLLDTDFEFKYEKENIFEFISIDIYCLGFHTQYG